MIALADRRELAELGLLGSALMAASVMPLVHGLVTPDVLYDDTEAFRTSVFLSLPIAIAAARAVAHTAFGVRALGRTALARLVAAVPARRVRDRLGRRRRTPTRS